MSPLLGGGGWEPGVRRDLWGRWTLKGCWKGFRDRMVGPGGVERHLKDAEMELRYAEIELRDAEMELRDAEMELKDAETLRWSQEMQR